LTVTVLALLIPAAVLFITAYRRKDNSHVKALKSGARTLKGVMPLLLLALLVAGLLEAVIPPEVVQSWLGNKSGLKGILLGSIAGALIPGGPYVTFPIIASIYKAGAGIGTTVALVTGWAVAGVGQLPYELALVGWRFMLVRLCLAVIIPPLAGVTAQLAFGGGF